MTGGPLSLPADEGKREPAGRASSTGSRWAAWSAIVAALSLAAALIFNGIQLHNSAAAQRQAKLATELGLLTQLESTLDDSVYRRVRYTRQFRELRAGLRDHLTRPAFRVTAEEAASMDYFAWLFNSGHLTARGADELWGPRMICEYKQAFAPAFEDPARDVPQLVKFSRKRGRRLSRLVSAVRSCPIVGRRPGAG
jgi:hypothetical protein